MADASKMAMEFLIGEDGHYVKKRNPLFEAIVKIDRNPTAATVNESLTYHARKIPGPRFRSWLAFCRDVAKQNNGYSEAGLMLLYHPEKKEWQAFPPKQDLSSVHVDFTGVTDALERFREKHGKEWMLAGTLHSHPGGAEPSSIDVEDEKKMDGVHLVVPDFGRRETGIVAHVCASHSRFVVRQMPMLIDLKLQGEEGYPKDEWLKQIKFGYGNRKSRGGYTYGGVSYDGDWDGWEGIRVVNGIRTAETYHIEIEKKKVNILSKRYDSLDVKDALRIVGFSKKERKFLRKTFEDDIRDMTIVFDYVRDTIKCVLEINGQANESEKKEIVEKCALAAESAFDCIKSFSDRRIEEAVKKGEMSQEAPEEEKEEKEEVEEEEEVITEPGEKEVVRSPEEEGKAGFHGGDHDLH